MHAVTTAQSSLQLARLWLLLALSFHLLTGLATEVFLGDPSRFARGNQVASYIGLIPCEHSSGKRQRLGKLTKEGNSVLSVDRNDDEELKRFYRRKLIQKGMGKARIAVARKLGIRLWILRRNQIDYEEFCRRGKLRQRGKPMRGCLISTVVLHGSDRVTE